MKNIIVLSVLLIFTFATIGQSRKIFLEEFSGAQCGNCPMGDYFADSLLKKYPQLIAVSLHAYQPADAMIFPEISTLYNTYSAGAPMAVVDRVNFGGQYIAQSFFQWENMIQQRISIPPTLSLSINPVVWDSVTREITAHVNIEILSNLVAGDYRVSLYIVEDSVIGIGSGYDQVNYYNTQVGNPFYGLGDPIVGYIHKHVARALLPSAWGLSGLISSSPIAGEFYSHIFNYTLPPSYNEEKISLIGFVNRFSSDHQTDEVLNAEEVKLSGSTGTDIINAEGGGVTSVYPNPSYHYVTIDTKNDREQVTVILYNSFGHELKRLENITGNNHILSLSDYSTGVYFIKIISRNGSTEFAKVLKF